MTEQQALALKAAGKYEQAAEAFRLLARAQPKHHGPLYNLGNTYLAAQRPAEAIEPFRRAIRLAPRFAHAHNNLGLALLATGQPALAAASFARAVALDPDNPAPRHLAGHALLRAGDPARALAFLRAANEIAPGQAAIVTDLGDALRRTGAIHDVVPLAREAAALAPNRCEAWNNLAIALRDIGLFDEAEAASHTALRLSPGNDEAHYNLALTLLAAGKLRQAWPHWEHRWGGVRVAPRLPTAPWDGAPLGDGVLYLHAEQGLGDTIQFCRYAAMAAAHARVVLAVQAPLVNLLRSLPGDLVLRDAEAPPPDFAAHAPLLSLPRAFDTDIGSIPACVPYLRADPARAARWAERLGGLAGLKVGLVWAGNRDFPFDAARSMPVAALAPLAIDGVDLVSLQLGRAESGGPKRTDWTTELADFADTAALVAGLDLVIGVDTAVIHLAGALGRPVWLLNRFAGDWRWDATGHTTPWYPTMRIFRQQTPGDWGSVVAAVHDALRVMLRLTD
jgi:tetratricopeptide (TPR) repeat protein